MCKNVLKKFVATVLVGVMTISVSQFTFANANFMPYPFEIKTSSNVAETYVEKQYSESGADLTVFKITNYLNHSEDEQRLFILVSEGATMTLSDGINNEHIGVYLVGKDGTPTYVEGKTFTIKKDAGYSVDYTQPDAGATFIAEITANPDLKDGEGNLFFIATPKTTSTTVTAPVSNPTPTTTAVQNPAPVSVPVQNTTTVSNPAPVEISAPTTVSNTTTKTVNTQSLYVRAGAGVSYKAIGSVNKGEVVTIIETYGSWSQISYNRNGQVKTGYVYNPYLK